MVVRLNVNLDISLEIADEAEFRADAIEQLSRLEGTWESEFIQDAIDDAEAGV